jgi:enolase
MASHQKTPLFRYFSDFLQGPISVLPRPLINIFSGGIHAGCQVALQDIQIVALSARSISEAMAMTFEVYQCAAELSYKQYGARKLTADEGGLAPPFSSAEQMLEDTVNSITAAGFEAGKDISIAIDLAASQFYRAGEYYLEDQPLDSLGMIERIGNWVDNYPVISVEDGLAEEDWDYWPILCKSLEGRAMTLGDDFLCTNPVRVRRAIEVQAADSLLLKVNQIGSLSEAAESFRIARSAGWKVVPSARSGETEDSWLSDLVVGWGGSKIKIGSITQSERLAKYNRLLQIEAETDLPLAEW